jgi:tetratricopeptide (TPR) repeat protein
MLFRTLRSVACLWACLLSSGLAGAQDVGGGCGSLANGFGPFDYRKHRQHLPAVENHHFTAPVEALVKGLTGTIGADIDYTLRAFPNHHRALLAMARWTERIKNPHPPGANYPTECYFIRALHFANDDNVVRMLYAQFLGQGKRVADAIQQLEAAASTAGENGFTHYNIGMVYAELGEMDRALSQAHRAMALGFGRVELKAILERAGKWRDPPN